MFPSVLLPNYLILNDCWLCKCHLPFLGIRVLLPCLEVPKEEDEAEDGEKLLWRPFFIKLTRKQTDITFGTVQREQKKIQKLVKRPFGSDWMPRKPSTPRNRANHIPLYFCSELDDNEPQEVEGVAVSFFGFVLIHIGKKEKKRAYARLKNMHLSFHDDEEVPFFLILEFAIILEFGIPLRPVSPDRMPNDQPIRGHDTYSIERVGESEASHLQCGGFQRHVVYSTLRGQLNPRNRLQYPYSVGWHSTIFSGPAWRGWRPAGPSSYDRGPRRDGNGQLEDSLTGHCIMSSWTRWTVSMNWTWERWD